MSKSDQNEAQEPWYLRQVSELRPPSPLDPVEDTVICPECNAVDWDVQEEPSVSWRCIDCGYVWDLPSTD